MLQVGCTDRIFFELISDATRKPPCFLNLASGKRKSEIKLFFTAFFDRFCHFNRAYATHRSFGRPLVKSRSPEMEPGPQTLLYQFANPCKSQRRSYRTDVQTVAYRWYVGEQQLLKREDRNSQMYTVHKHFNTITVRDEYKGHCTSTDHVQDSLHNSTNNFRIPKTLSRNGTAHSRGFFHLKLWDFGISSTSFL